MTKQIERLSEYAKGEERMFCDKVLLEDGTEAYEILFVDYHVYRNTRGKAFGRLPWSKIFTDIDKANRYALAVIKKQGYKRTA